MHQIILVEHTPLQRCFCGIFTIQSRIATLMNSKGNITEINSPARLSVSPVLSQRGLRGQAGHETHALPDSLPGTHSGWFSARAVSAKTHGSSVRHVPLVPLHNCRNCFAQTGEISDPGFLLKSLRFQIPFS